MLPFQIILKNNNDIKRSDIENSPLDGTVQSGQSAITLYVVCRVIMGFEQKLSKKSYFHSISKMTRPTGHFGILLSAKLAV